MAKRIVLYFIADDVPTETELAEGLALGARFRNSRLVEPGDTLERCDAVAGLVPERYRDVDGVEFIEAETKVPGSEDGKGEDEAATASQAKVENTPTPTPNPWEKKPEAKA